MITLTLFDKSNSNIARRLSEFHREDFTIDGKEYNSLIGYMMYITTGGTNDAYRHLSPYTCLDIYKEDEKVWVDNLTGLYRRAVELRLKQLPGLYNDFKEIVTAFNVRFKDYSNNGKFRAARFYNELVRTL